MFYKNCLVKSGRSFGTLLNQTGSTDNDYLFTGEQYDSELDNYYLRARYYDQNVGRFTQMDTWMGNTLIPSSLNKFVYAESDPVNNYDPSGNFLVSSGLNNTIRSALLAARINAKSYISIFSNQVGKAQVKRNFSQLNRYTRRSGIKKRVKDEIPTGLEEAKVMLEVKLGAGIGIGFNVKVLPRLIRAYGEGKWIKRSHDNGQPGSGKKNKRKGIAGRRVEVHYFYNITHRYGVEY
ncbi:RHS repeat-associated core domain-containing protein [Aestuariibacter sp. AA17]|uniref:RHS repeat-associated core domain-containing protein n=1 Tax=Fluctibacter corallii TaxID=2984329 RepID=A0ABT3AA56_9ALTE|nr:RHS repeat-associated core domain-containing protein [Aestuariibacter sp. AA17]MCV2885508.1 RHS repeat-associated core domain-containing protein [Aestuariibacter sp. AA17]